MATGYTSGLTEETTFERFALSCARAFGALIDMRDDPNDAPIPERMEPHAYYRDALAKAERKLAEMEAWPMAKFAADQAESIESDRQADERYRAEALAKLNAYNRMLAKVVEWTPPSVDHEGMKRFMVEQLTSSREHDCTPYQRNRIEVSADEWRTQRLDSQRESVKRYQDEWRKEVERTEGRNLWLRQLRDSLSVPA